MFVVNMTFISSREVKKMYISFLPLALMKYTFFSLHSMKQKSYSLQTFEYSLHISVLISFLRF